MITIVVITSDGSTKSLQVADPTVLDPRTTEDGSFRVTSDGSQRVIDG